MQNVLEKIKRKSINGKMEFLTRVMATLMIMLGIGALFGAFQLNAQTKKLANNWMVANNIGANLNYLTSEYRLNQYQHVVTDANGDYDAIEKRMDNLLTEINSQMALYEKIIQSDTDRQYFEAAGAAWKEYLSLDSELLRLSRNMELEQANALMTGEGYSEFMDFQENFDLLLAFNKEQASKCTDGAMMVFYAILGMVVIMVAIAIVMGTALSKVITKNITDPINELMTVTEAMTKGNLSAPLTYQGEDELGVLADSMRFTQSTLSDYIKEISEILTEIAKGDLTRDFRKITDFLGDFGSIKESFVYILQEFNMTLASIQDASLQVENGATGLAGAASDLASGTTQQASAVQELTATINTVNSMAEESAQRAEESYHDVSRSVKEAEKEKQQMSNLQAEMAHIKEISNEIEAIIATIEDIASQTSLLSLNASIEAARAGEAGRGFAVVADQIGKLATDSAQAAVTTKDLINKTIEEIDKGNKITEATVVGFERIIRELHNFADMAQQNSETSLTQAHALNQIDAGIEQISVVTQQNAASSEECSAISQELSARASELDSLVKKFILYK